MHLLTVSSWPEWLRRKWWFSFVVTCHCSDRSRRCRRSTFSVRRRDTLPALSFRQRRSTVLKTRFTCTAPVIAHLSTTCSECCRRWQNWRDRSLKSYQTRQRIEINSDHLWTLFSVYVNLLPVNCGEFYGTETVQGTPLRGTLASSATRHKIKLSWRRSSQPICAYI